MRPNLSHGVSCMLALLITTACGKAASDEKDASGTTKMEQRLLPLQHDLCHDGGWCWVSPRPHGNDLLDIVASSSADIWAVGAWGTVMHYDGTTWRSESIGGATLTRVWPRAPDDVWAIGYGVVAHRDVDGWEVLWTGSGVRMTDIDGVGDEVWIVGEHALSHEDGVMLHWNGRQMVRTGFPPRSTLAIEVVATDDIWVGGESLQHFDGQAWTTDDALPLGACTDFHAFAPDNLWCTDSDGRLFHRTNDRWSFALADGSLAPYRGEVDLPRALAVEGMGRKEGRFMGSAPEDFHVEINGEVFHWDGKRWQKRWTLPQSGKWIAAVTFTNTGELWAVGAGGTVLHGRDEPWTEMSQAIGNRVKLIVPEADGSVFVADPPWHGKSMPIAKLVDGVLVESRENVPIHDGQLDPSDDAPHARRLMEHLGWSANEETIAFFDGSNWISGANPIPQLQVTGAWAAGPREAWVIASGTSEWADAATILKWDGEAWKIVQQFEDVQLSAIDGVDSEHVWVGGTAGLLRWDGAKWAAVPEMAGRDEYGYSIVGIEALAHDDIWVADASAVHHFDGTSWTTEEIGIDVISFAATVGRVWVGGHKGLLAKTL